MPSRLGSLGLAIAIGLLVLLTFRFTPASSSAGQGADLFAPLSGLISTQWQRFQSFSITVEAAGELKADNDRLQAQVDELTQDLVRLPELERENAELREQLGLKQSLPKYNWKSARIIGREPGATMQGLVINRGLNDGVQKGMTVVSTNGSLVGRVVSVGASASQVLLITDVSSSVAALVQESRAHGVVNGLRPGTLIMKYIRQGEQLKTGQMVITSGEGGVFPEGFLVGKVTDVRQVDIEMFQEARVDSLADFDRLETVLVVTSYRPPKLD